MDELYADLQEREVIIHHKKKEYTITIRDITWAEKNKIISNCLKYNKTGEPSFDLAKYNTEMLLKILVKAPFPINEMELMKLDSNVGRQLEKLIPAMEVEEKK